MGTKRKKRKISRIKAARIELRKLDKNWSKSIKESFDGKCAICGSTYYCQAHHLIPRERKKYRHDLKNGILLCCRHHRFSRELSAHSNSLAFALWLQNNRPDIWEWVVANIDQDNDLNGTISL